MRKNIFVYIGYLLLFLAYFSQYPIHDSLPGNLDTWWFIHVFEQLNFIKLFISSKATGIPGYPDGNLLLLGDVSIATSVLFNFIQFFVNDKIVSYYLLISIIFSLNCFSMYLCSKHFYKNFGTRLFTGLIFGAAPFFIGSIDNLGVVSAYSSIFSIYFFLNYMSTKKAKNLVPFILFSVIQILSGYYFFLFSVIINFFLYVSFSIKYKTILISFKLILSVIVVILFFSGFSYLYKIAINTFNAVNPINVFTDNYIKLLPTDLIRPLWNNLLYPTAPLRLNSDVINGEHGLFMGASIWLLVFLVFIKRFSYLSRTLLILVFVGVLIALGSHLSIGSVEIKMPMYFVYKYIHTGILRISIKAYFISHFSICLLAGIGLNNLSKYFSSYKLVFLFSILFVLETISFPLPLYKSYKYINIPKDYQAFLKENETADLYKILDLPSSLYSQVCLNEDLYPYSIDFIYTVWQVQHKQNIVNGRAGFIPENRIQIDELVQNINTLDNLDILIERYGISLIVIHKWLQCTEDELSLYSNLLSHKNLQLMQKSDSIIILKVIE